jgi:hypothetical protein
VRDWKRALLIYTGVFLAYVLLTLVMTWPVVAKLNTHLVGNGDDMWVHYWNNWWVKQVLQQGADLYYTHLLFHPTGVRLVYHNFAWVNIALWLVLEPLVGGIVAYNLVYLIHMPLCGLGMFLLSRRLTKSDAVAFVSGLVFAFWPYRMLDVNHPNMISTEGFPFLTLALLRLFQDERLIRDGIIAGVLSALIGYMRWQLLILAGFWVALYLLYTLIWERERWSWQRGAALALTGVVAVALMVPGLYPLVREQSEEGGFPQELYTVSASDPEQDLLAWIIPQHQHPLGELYTRLSRGYGRSSARGRYSAFLGYVAVGLAVVGVVKRRKRKETWFWLGLALLCFVLALGPHLRFDDVDYASIPLPYQLIGWLPLIRMLRYPHRFSTLLGLSIAVLVGYGALALREWLAPRRWGSRVARPVVFTSLLGLLLLLDYLSIPTATVSAHVPAFYSTLAEEAGDFAIVGLPGKRQITEHYMFYQTTHSRPLLGGHVSRLPPHALEFASSVPLVEGMYRSQTGGINTEIPDISRQLSLLAGAGFRYIVLHKELAEPGLLAEWQSYLAVSPWYEDEEVTVHSTTPVVGQDAFLEYDLGAGIGLIHTSLSTGNTAPDSVLELEFVWGTTAPPETDLQVEIALVDDEGNVGQAQRLEISPTWPTGEWPVNAIVRDRFTFQVDPRLTEGIYAVVVGLVRKEDGQPVGQKAEVGAVLILETGQGLSASPIVHRVGAGFGDVLRLLGYGLEASTDAARVTLHWQALRRMEESYKFFVHLVDAESGTLAAQVDVVPLDWTHPTTEWQAEEIVSDQLVLPLEEVPPGRYRLWVGVYHPDTGERLSIGDMPDGFVFNEGRFMLPGEVVR